MDIVEVLVVIAAACVAVCAIWLAVDPGSKSARYANLIAVAVALFLGVSKVWADSQEKQFLRMALISSLNLSTSARQQLGKDVLEHLQASGRCYEGRDGLYQQNGDGTTFFVKECGSGKPASFVLNRFEMAEIYANAVPRYRLGPVKSQVEATSRSVYPDFLIKYFGAGPMPVPAESHEIIDRALTRTYTPSVIEEDLNEKIAITGFHVLRVMKFQADDNYYWDDDEGVIVRYFVGFERRDLPMTRDEIKGLPQGTALEVLSIVEQRWREKIAGLTSR